MLTPKLRHLSQNNLVNSRCTNYARFNTKFNGFKFQIC
jgi:hypothetical protein